MAKKNKGTFSYIETQQALEHITEKCTKENLVYELLRIFCGYGDASIQRIIDGRGNDAMDIVDDAINFLMSGKKVAYDETLQKLITEE